MEEENKPGALMSAKESYAEIKKEIGKEADSMMVEPILSLSTYIKKCWDAAKEIKKPHQKQMKKSALQRRSEYTGEKIQQIVESTGQNSIVYIGLTSIKCRAAISWFIDVLSNIANIWDIAPTPIPDINPMLQQYAMAFVERELETKPEKYTAQDKKELSDLVINAVNKAITEEAERSCELMRRKMHDQMTEAKFKSALYKVVSDIVTYKAGILKGPVVRRKDKLQWIQDEDGTWVARRAEVIDVDYERVSPFDMYPSPSSTSIDDGYLIQYYSMTRKDLTSLMGVPGYNEVMIRKVLDDYKENKIGSCLWDEEELRDKREAQGIDHDAYLDNPEGKIEALEFWGYAPGQMLLDWGMDGEEIPDPYMEYQINGIMIGQYVIKAVLNPHPMGKKPFYKCSYEELPDCFWGHGVPELMEDIQDICNACVRSLVVNMAIASGPQSMVDLSQLTAGTNAEEVYPLKVWYYDSSDSMSRNVRPIEFFMPESNVTALLGVFERFEDKAEEVTGIPSYVYGSTDIGGAGRTATGLSMLMTNASKGIKLVLEGIDNNIIKLAVEELYTHNMMFSTDQSIKGDLQVVAKGVTNLIEKEQMEIRQIDFMNMMAKNEIYLSIIGRKGIAKMLRKSVKSIMGADDIIPSDNELEAQEVMQQQILQQGVNPVPEKALTETTPAGQKLGGVDQSLFVNRSR